MTVNRLKANSKPRGFDSAVAEAHRLYVEAPLSQRDRREAYLLTTEPLEAVAHECSIPTEVVGTYHDLFFDVRPHQEDAAETRTPNWAVRRFTNDKHR
jgi:hypothetical protein